MRRVLHSLSLRARLVALVGVLMVAIAVFFLLYSTRSLEQRSRRWAEVQASQIARVLARASGPALDFRDAAYAQEQLEALASVPSGRYAVLLLGDGRPLASWRRSPDEEVPGPGAPGTWVRGDRVHARTPLSARAGQDGTLLVGFSLEELERERTATLADVLLASLLVLAAGLAGAFAVGTILVAPLQRLTRVADRITAGELQAQQELDLTRGDESGRLAAALDRMLRRLQEQRELLESHGLQLERRVAERTQELGETNAQLAERLRELRAAQEQLIVADRFQSVGLLAAGVAHEINNPLAYVMSNLAFVADMLDPIAKGTATGRDQSEAAAALQEASQGCERVRHIVHSLKTFSRGDEDRRTPLDVREVLEGAARMAANELRHRARVVRAYDDVRPVLASEVRLNQVFLNLLINAAHAMEQGSPSSNELRLTIRGAPGNRVEVAISDTGHGMSPEVRAQLFTPFFTTKPVGVGTGLGLSVCHGIVRGMGGEIRVESEPGRGSTFTVVLPASAEAPARVDPTVQTALRPAAPARARILVIDDEPLVGAALRRSLGREHDVEVAASAREGLAWLGRSGGADAILCDLMMPEMTGIEFAAELERRSPQLAGRLLFMSGGAFTEAASSFAERNGDRLVEKPLDIDALRARLARLAPVLRSREEGSSSTAAPVPEAAGART